MTTKSQQKKLDDALGAYKNIEAQAQEAYTNIEAPDLESYGKAESQAWESYEKAESQAWEAYKKKCGEVRWEAVKEIFMRRHILIWIFVASFLVTLAVVNLAPRLLQGGDFFTHQNILLGAEYPRYIHLVSHQIRIPWEVINSIAVAALITSLVYAFGWKAAALIIGVSKAGTTILIGGLAPTMFAFSIILVAYKSKTRWVQLLSAAFSRSAFMVGSFLAAPNWKIRGLLLLLSAPLLVSVATYTHIPQPMELSAMFLDYGVLMVLFSWGCMVSQPTHSDIEFIMLAFLMLLLAPFTYQGRVLFMFAIFSGPALVGLAENHPKSLILCSALGLAIQAMRFG